MTVRIEKKGRRIEVASNAPLPGFKTAIPGAYQTVGGSWTVPLNMETCKLLRQKFGRGLVIGPQLKRWAQGVTANRKSMAELAKATDAPIEKLQRVAPRLYKAMRRRRYQRVGVRFIADNHATLLADEPGLGKTLMLMGGILEAGIPGPYLIIAPKTASDSVWRREILHWLPEGHRPVIMPELRAQRERKLRGTRYGPRTWVIIHPEMVMVKEWLRCEVCSELSKPTGKQQTMLTCKDEDGHRHRKTRRTEHIYDASYPKLFEIEWGAVVADESHETLIVRNGVPTERRRGMGMLKTRSDGIRVAMSGTPFDSKPYQLWGTLNWLDPKQYSAKHRWVELFWQKGGYTGFETGEFIKEREPLLWDSLSAIALRRTKAEVAPDLPPKTYVGSPLEPSDPQSPVGVWLPMDGRQEKAYRQMEALSMADLESGRLDALSALAELTRLKQLACCYGDITEAYRWVDCHYPSMGRDCPQGLPQPHKHKERYDKYVPRLPSNKFEWTKEALEEWGYPRNPLTRVVIVSFFTGILEAFGQGFEHHFKRKRDSPLCAYITGKTPQRDRRNIIDRYNGGDGPDILLLNVKAGGTAITIDTADRMIFISRTRTPDKETQAEDRIHRISNPRQCMYYYLYSEGTVDVGTAVLSQQLDEQSRRLLDGRRGVEYMRQVMELSRA